MSAIVPSGYIVVAVRRNLSAALAFAAVVALVFAGACGSKGSGTPAAAIDSNVGADGNNAADTGAASCDPFAQDCGAGKKCDFGCQGTAMVVACWPSSGGGAIGDACTTAMSCAAGSGCVGISTQGTACRKYCATDGDCASGERCHNDTVGLNCAGTVSSMLLHFCHP
jgi:hypothetical protein